MPQRTQGLCNVGFFDVLDLVEYCKVRHDHHNVVSVHGLALKAGVLALLPASTSLLTAYSRAGDYSSSVAVFGEVSCKDVVVWNAMITSAVENGLFRDGISWFRQMLQEGIEFDSLTLAIVISAVSRITKRLACLQAVHSLGVKKGLVLDCDLCNSLMNMYSKCNQMQKAEILFMSAQDKDLVSWNTMISGYSQNGNLALAQLLFKKLMYECVECTLATVLAVLSSCNSPTFIRFGNMYGCAKLFWQFFLLAICMDAPNCSGSS